MVSLPVEKQCKILTRFLTVGDQTLKVQTHPKQLGASATGRSGWRQYLGTAIDLNYVPKNSIIAPNIWGRLNLV